MMGNDILLVEKHIIKKSNSYFNELDNLCFLSKNLYNATLYFVRQHYLKTSNYMNYYEVNRIFTRDNQVDYRALPAKVAKHTQMLVDNNFKSFFALIKKEDYSKPVHIPKYLNKKKGKQVVFYEKGALSFKKEGYIKLSKTNILIKTNQDKNSVQFVRIVPKGLHIVVEVGYKKQIIQHVDNPKYASIDLGLNNLMTITSNVMKPFIINGKPLKSMNQYYNKKLSKLKSELEIKENRKHSRRISKLHEKRYNKVTDYIHKATNMVVNQLVSNQISTLVIGYNKEWKQDITIGRRNNQNFVNIPYSRIISQLEYKCKLAGIKVELQEESYTSKCSFLDNEDISRHEIYIGNRITRGLFRTATDKLINADVNGSLNILKKYLIRKEAWNMETFMNCVEVSSMPNLLKLTIGRQ